MLRFLKNFGEKFSKNFSVFVRKLLLVFANIVIITLVIEKNAKYFAENWPKSQKIVNVTSTPGTNTTTSVLTTTTPAV
jgi:hypothetical protein